MVKKVKCVKNVQIFNNEKGLFKVYVFFAGQEYEIDDTIIAMKPEAFVPIEETVSTPAPQPEPVPQETHIAETIPVEEIPETTIKEEQHTEEQTSTVEETKVEEQPVVEQQTLMANLEQATVTPDSIDEEPNQTTSDTNEETKTETRKRSKKSNK